MVFGPATFINTAVNGIVDEFAKRQAAAQRQARAGRARGTQRCRSGAATRRPSRSGSRGPRREAVTAQFTQYVLQLALRYGITGIPRIDDPSFVSALVFDSGSGDPGVPKSRFAYLFPSQDAAMITIRLKPDLSDAAAPPRDRPVPDRDAAARVPPRTARSYLVTGVPVVSEGLADAVQDSIFVLLGAALLVMAATLALVFRTRLRLLPLGLALAAAALTFGALSLAGGDLTMASIAVLPVLIGLAVDYAIQFQARFDEQRERARGRPARGGRRGRGRGRADDRHRRHRHRGRLPRAAAVARSRWCAASARCWCWASRSRSPARSAPASPRSCASGPASRPRRRCRACASALAALGAHPRVAERRASGSPTAPGARSASRSPARGRVLAIALVAGRGRGSRWTPRARSSRTCASSCRATSRRSRT